MAFDNLKRSLAKRWGFDEASAAKRDPKKTTLKILGNAIRMSGGQFEYSTVDLMETSRGYYTDSYIRRAVDKYSELVFKGGWDLQSKNQAASDYVNLRLAMMAEATRTPTLDFFRMIAFDVVLFGNAFIVKQRQGNLPPGIKAQGYTSNKPVLGYFALPPTTMQISRDPLGTLLLYQQNATLGGSAGGGQIIQIKPEDMIHIAYKKQTGRAYGIPFIWNAMDDVKILRQLEENVARLVYRHLFPLYQYQVGLPQAGFEATDEEIDYIREQIRAMPMDGGIVVPERHNISVVSDNSGGVDASPYLQYMRERVFAGLMMSPIVMGIGDIGMATADNLSAELIDGVKEFQTIIKNKVQFEIINELLFEGGFDPTANPDDAVEFVLPEIELDAKIKKENHLVQLFTQNAITHEEMRHMMGLEPVADESRLAFNMIQASLDTNAAHAKAQAANNAGQNKNNPVNQNGPKGSPGKPKRSQHHSVEDEDHSLTEEIQDDFSTNALTEDTQRVNLLSELGISSKVNGLTSTWKSLRDDVTNMAQRGKDMAYIRAFAIGVTRQTLENRIKKYVTDAFLNGIMTANTEIGSFKTGNNNTVEANKLTKRVTIYVDRLMKDVEKSISTAILAESDDKLIRIMAAFDANEYRITFLMNNEVAKAYNYGRAIAARNNKLDTIEIHTMGTPDCKTCADKAKEAIDVNRTDLLDAIPPHHPNCSCKVKLNKPGGGVN